MSTTKLTNNLWGGDLPQCYSFNICAVTLIIVRIDKPCNMISTLTIVIIPDTDTYETNYNCTFPLKAPFLKFRFEGTSQVSECPCVALLVFTTKNTRNQAKYSQANSTEPLILNEQQWRQGMPILSSRLFARSLSQPRCFGSNPWTQDSGKAEKPSRQPRKAPARQQLTLLWPPCIASRLMVDL